MFPSRNELYLMKLAGEEVELPPAPLSRNEEFLAYLATQPDEVVDLPVPQSRIELYLARCCGLEVDLPPEPLSETEIFLAKLAGEDVELPIPTTRINILLATIIDNGGFAPEPPEPTYQFRSLMNMDSAVYTDLYDITTLADYCFSYDPVLEEVTFPSVTAIPNSCFENAEKLRKAVFPEATRTAGNRCFSGCTGLEELRLPKCTSGLSDILSSTALESMRILDTATTAWNFNVSSNGKCLELVILRGQDVVTGNPAFHSDCPIAQGTGQILVQPDLVNAYKTAWPTYASIIGPISEP